MRAGSPKLRPEEPKVSFLVDLSETWRAMVYLLVESTKSISTSFYFGVRAGVCIVWSAGLSRQSHD